MASVQDAQKVHSWLQIRAASLSCGSDVAQRFRNWAAFPNPYLLLAWQGL